MSNKPKSIFTGALEKLGVKPTSSILIAFSGGADSTALTGLFGELRDEWDFRLGCAYYDHKLRSRRQTMRDLKHITSMAARNKLELHIGEAGRNQLRSEAASTGDSLEDVARRHRYHFLETTREEHGYDYIATGHTADDQTETLIQRFFQGSGIDGLSGIPERSGQIIRPLIDVSKSELLRYLAKRNLRFIEDVTNRSNRYLRNKIRNVAVPLINGIFPGHKKAIETLREKMHLAHDFLLKESERKLRWVRCSDGFAIPVKTYMQAHPILRLYSLYGLYDEHITPRKPDERLPYSFLRPAVNAKSVKNGMILLTGHGFSMRIEGDDIFWRREVVFAGKKSYLISVNRCEDKNTQVFVETDLLVIKEMDISPIIDAPHVKADGIEYPLVVRSRREGDVIAFDRGNKTVKELLSEWNVPEEDRWEIPVVEDKRGILAVMGGVMDYPNAISARGTTNPDAETGSAMYIYKRPSEVVI